MYNFLGYNLQSNIIIGSGPLSYGSKGIINLHNAGAGAIVTKTIRTEAAVNPANHMMRLGKTSLINCEKWSDFTPEKWIHEEFPKLRKTDAIVIASIGHTVDETRTYVKDLEKAGAHMIEIVSYNEKDMIPVIKDTKKQVSIPVIVKLPSMIQNIGDFAKECILAGADAITACDSLGPVMRIDINTGYPICGGDGSGWLTGSDIKPITIQKIFEIRQKVKIPIIGLGGCINENDGIEMMMAGANCIGLCSIVILRGASVIGKINDGLDKKIKELGYNKLEDIISLTHKKNIEPKSKIIFSFEKEKCTHCGVCEKVCCYFARQIEDDMHLNEKECRYCGLCVSVCPTNALKGDLVN